MGLLGIGEQIDQYLSEAGGVSCQTRSVKAGLDISNDCSRLCVSGSQHTRGDTRFNLIRADTLLRIRTCF